MLCYYQLQENACNQSDFFKFCRVKHGKGVQNKTNCSDCHSPKMYHFQTNMFEWICKKAGEEIWGTELMGFCVPGTGGFAPRAFAKTFTHVTVAFVAFLASVQKADHVAAI